MLIIDLSGINKVDKIMKSLPDKAKEIKYRAVQRAALAGKSEATRQGRNRYNLKSSEITKTFKLIKPNKENSIAELETTGKRIRLIKYKVTPKNIQKKRTNRLVKVSVIKSQGMKTLKNAFLTKTANGVTGIFERETKKRLPIRQLYGPSVPQLFKEPTIKEAIKSRANEVLENRIVYELNKYLGE